MDTCDRFEILKAYRLVVSQKGHGDPTFEPPVDLEGFEVHVEVTTDRHVPAQVSEKRRAGFIQNAASRSGRVKAHIQALGRALQALGLGTLRCPVVILRDEVFPPPKAHHHLAAALFEHADGVLVVSATRLPNESPDHQIIHDLLHESGHHYWRTMSPDRQARFVAGVTSKDDATRVTRSPSDYGLTSIEEAFAEWFAWLGGEALAAMGIKVVAGPPARPHGGKMDAAEFSRLGGPVFGEGHEHAG